MTEHVETDDLFGELTLHLDRDGGLVRVGGPGVPTATLRRTGEPRPESYAPIGTRTAADLVAEVAGTPAELVLAPGGLTRRSYRVDMRHAGVEYRLVPNASEKSVLLRDGTRIGRFWAVHDAGVSAQWQVDRGIEPLDASVGYLLSTAFGTGAQHVLVSLVSAVFHF